jgi:hypothetical protein
MTSETQSTGLAWHKSSYSNGSGGDCVEVAQPEAGLLVRDSKRPDGGVMTVGSDAWAAFVSGFCI